MRYAAQHVDRLKEKKHRSAQSITGHFENIIKFWREKGKDANFGCASEFIYSGLGAKPTI